MRVKINKKVILEEDGIWDRQQRAHIQHLNNIDQVKSDIYDNNPGQYFFNPFVSGPISHGYTKGVKNIHNALYKGLKDDDSPDASTQANIRADVNKGAFNSELDVVASSIDQYKNAIEQARIKDPIQSIFNPFVAGPLTNVLINNASSNIKNMRYLTSPTSAYGDTLKK